MGRKATLVNSALILAGGGAPDDLVRATGVTERALIELDGTPMLVHVMRAVAGTAGIERLAVVGSEAVLQVAQTEAEIVAVAGGARMVDNLRNGIVALAADGPLAGGVLVVSCDIPLAVPKTYEALLAAYAERDLELAYPVVRRGVSEAAFAGAKRTYARLREGEFTGGNAVVFPARILDEVLALAAVAYNARKRPLALARLLGARLLFRFATRRLAIADIERRAGTVLRCRVGAIEMNDATIAFDVDKLSDLQAVQIKMQERKQL